MPCPARTYPLRKPENHRVPIPRWKLRLPDSVDDVYTTYIGIQQHHDTEPALQAKCEAIQAVQKWCESGNGPSAWETFIVIDGCDVEETAIWVCYWNYATETGDRLETLSLPNIHKKLTGAGRSSIGIWQESFVTAVSRLETNYSGLDYLPGLARLPNADTEEHTLSTYWGAARDRIPDSAHDLFPRAADIKRPDIPPKAIGQHLIGTNHSNLVHIRSGQFWENCGQQEADAYERKLEPTLRAGLKYLCENAKETGVMGLRYLRNESLPIDRSRRESKESCGAGFFANLEDLENWAKTHQSHLKIWRGALSHYKEFGDLRRFRTWHEVCVIKEGDATFEYINCTLETGVIRSIPLQVQSGWSVPS